MHNPDSILPSSVSPPAGPDGSYTYTVPTIHHQPTNQYITESALIAEFLESAYPDPTLPLSTVFGCEIERQARLVIRLVFRGSIMPRELNTLSPVAWEFFLLSPFLSTL
ncbi:hypothetical protein N7454_010680 [Penicillium verhagenii]|nr:hypothetical protein N7454_010680 [Penicillium verhagenii]